MTTQTSSHSDSRVLDLGLIRKALREASSSSAGQWIRVNCPYCRSVAGKQDRQASFGISKKTGRGHCFRCKTWLYLSEFGNGASDAIGIASTTPDETVIKLPSGFKPLWTGEGATSPAFRFAREYLENRGIPAQTIQDAGIGACATGRCNSRVVVPAFSTDGTTLVGWSARLTYNSTRWPKYLTATGMDREVHFWNMPAVVTASDEPLVICEGVFDALPYWPNAVALLGKPSDAQIWEIAKGTVATGRRVVVALDGDAWLEGEMLHLRLKLEMYRADLIRRGIGEAQAAELGLAMVNYPATWLRLPNCTDPGSVNTKNFWELAQKSAALGNNLVMGR